MPTHPVLQYSAIAVKLYSVGAVFGAPRPTQGRPGGCHHRGVWVALAQSHGGAQPMSIIHLAAVSGEEPSPADLAAIEQEWPLIAAELDLLNAEIAFISAGPEASVLNRRRVRRAERRVLK